MNFKVETMVNKIYNNVPGGENDRNLRLWYFGLKTVVIYAEFRDGISLGETSRVVRLPSVNARVRDAPKFQSFHIPWTPNALALTHLVSCTLVIYRLYCN